MLDPIIIYWTKISCSFSARCTVRSLSTEALQQRCTALTCEVSLYIDIRDLKYFTVVASDKGISIAVGDVPVHVFLCLFQSDVHITIKA